MASQEKGVICSLRDHIACGLSDYLLLGKKPLRRHAWKFPKIALVRTKMQQFFGHSCATRPYKPEKRTLLKGSAPGVQSNKLSHTIFNIIV